MDAEVPYITLHGALGILGLCVSRYEGSVIPHLCLPHSDHVCPCVCICAHLLSHVCLVATSGTVTRQAPLSMEFSRQEYWSGLPVPPPGDPPDPGIEPGVSCIAGRFFTI